ncbi:MAG: fumarylacetoacetate hydrolase family protein [Spirochaetota bacterium]
MVYLYRSTLGVFVRDPEGAPDSLVLCPEVSLDDVFRAERPVDLVRAAADQAQTRSELPAGSLLPLVEGQEVWAAGVTYYRSRTARMEESSQAGGGSFYDRVYEAERPEIFYKGNARTVVAPGAPVRIRDDSAWNVPEPELVLAINRHGRIIGYTAGNDMSSRDIEGENPLYLPQAKVYDGSCALGPALALGETPVDRSLAIELSITRGGTTAFEGRTSLEGLKRDPDELAAYLFRNQTFAEGCYLMTGTGIVPDDAFTLQAGDIVTISVGSLPPLVNPVNEERT